MSIWSKLTDILVRFYEGDLGAAMGDAAEAGCKPAEGTDLSTKVRPAQVNSVAFSIAMIALSAKMAKADGLVTEDEVAAFREIFHVPAAEEANVRRVFNLAQRDVAGFASYARQVARMFRASPGVLEDVLDGLFHIAKADRVMHPDEAAYLARVAEIFGFTEREWARIKASHIGAPADTPYLILGIDETASDDDVRKAFRRMVREHHPDALLARGVPPEFVDMAADKMAAINAAYAVIRKARGF